MSITSSFALLTLSSGSSEIFHDHDCDGFFFAPQIPPALASTHLGASLLPTWLKTLKDLHLELKVCFCISIFFSSCLMYISQRPLCFSSFFMFLFFFLSFFLMKIPTLNGQMLERQCLGRQLPRRPKTTATRRAATKRRLPITWTFTLSQ